MNSGGGALEEQKIRGCNISLWAFGILLGEQAKRKVAKSTENEPQKLRNGDNSEPDMEVNGGQNEEF